MKFAPYARYEFWHINTIEAGKIALQAKIKAKRFQSQVAALQKCRKIYADQLMGGSVSTWNQMRLEDIAIAVSNMQVEETKARMRKMREEFEGTIGEMEDDYDHLEHTYKAQQKELFTLQEDVVKKTKLVKELKARISEATSHEHEVTAELARAKEEVARAKRAGPDLKAHIKRLEARVASSDDTILALESQVKALTNA